MHPIEHLRYLARAGNADAPDLVLETASALSGLVLDPASVVVTTRRIVERHPLCGPLWWLCAHVVTASEPYEALHHCVEQVHDDRTAEHLAAELAEGALVCVDGWSFDVAHALAIAGSTSGIEVCVVDGDNGANHMIRVLERLEIPSHLVNASHGAIAAASADVVLLSAYATGSMSAWCSAGSLALASAAYCAERPVLLSASVGTRLPDVLYAGIVKDLDRQISQRREVRAWHREASEVPFGLCKSIVGSDGVHDVAALPAQGLLAQCPPAVELLTRSAI